LRAGALSLVSSGVSTELPMAWMRREGGEPAFPGADGVLEAVHEPTVKVVQQLRQARVRL
jgi:hypothetical protein